MITAQINFSNGEVYDVTYDNMRSIEANILDMKDTSLPSWSIISNGGKIQLIDYNGKIKELADQNQLNKETKVNIFLKNTSPLKQIQVGEFFAVNWSYDEDYKTVNVNLNDGLEKMQEIDIIPIVKSSKNVVDLTAQELYDNLQSQTQLRGFDMLSFSELDEKTKVHLSNYTIYLAYIENATLWNAWKQFCEALQVYIFKNRQGKIVCVYKEGK